MPDDMKWMDAGHCKKLPREKQADFFADNSTGINRAKKICNKKDDECPIKQTCLEYALAHNIEHGVWGGTSGRQRREMKKKQKVVLQVTNQ